MRRNGRHWTRKRGGDGGQKPTFAAIDLGTHNCRMLIAVPTRNGFRVIDSFSRTVRLGQDVTESGNLCETAVERTVEALAICADKMRHHNVRASRNVATAACRSAANCKGFLEKVIDETGLSVEIIPPEEEARLTLAGCAPLLAAEPANAIVFDIGGGSTEVAWVDLANRTTPKVRDVMSLCEGVVTFCEKYGGDRIAPATYRQMTEEIKRQFAPFEKANRIGELIAKNQVQMLGTSGTVTTLGAAYLKLPHYVRSKVDGLSMNFYDVKRVCRELADTDFHDRAANPCIGPSRADLVVPGCAILEAVCELWPVGNLRIADRGIREGIINELIFADRRDRQASAETRKRQAAN